MRLQLQKRSITGDPTDWVIVSIYYPIANFITVSVNKTTIQPILASSEQPIEGAVDTCGANKYFYKNGTISFIVTGSQDCQVRLSVTNNVQVSARIQTTVNDFFSKGGITTFVDRMCALLNITTDRLKVVGVFSGSVIVDFFVHEVALIAADTNDPSSTNTTIDPVQSLAELNAIKDQIAVAISNSAQLGELGSLASASTTVNIINTDGTAYILESNNTGPDQPMSS